MKAPIRPALMLYFALSLVALCYGSVFKAGFVWDDHPLIDEQPRTKQIQPLWEYFDREFWSDAINPDARGFYRPLVSLSYAVEWQLWNGDPRGFHFTNLLLHLVVCCLVFALARRAGAGPTAAMLATLAFGLHPRLTESVAWISGRTDVLACAFTLGALWLHGSPRARTAHRAAAGVCLFLGLLCKEVAFAGLAAIVAAEWKRASAWRERAVAMAPAGLAFATWGLLRATADAPAYFEPPPFPLWQRLTVFPLEALGRYLTMLADPLRPRIQIGVLGLPEPLYVGLGALVAAPALLAAFVWAWRRPGSTALPLFLLGALPLLMVLHVVPLALNVVAADRFLYVPLAALSIGVAAGSRSLAAALRPPAVALAAIAAVLFGFTTARHVPVWSDDLSLWRFGVAHAPGNNPLPHSQLGYALAWSGRPEEAVAAYRESLRISREHPVQGRSINASAQGNLALALSEIGEFEEARALLESVVRQRGFPIDHLQLALVHSRAMRFDEAAASLERARELVPDNPLVHSLIERVEETRRRWEALPPESSNEPIAVTAERAHVMALAGRVRDADALWIRVLQNPQAPPKLVQRAAVHLVYTGYQQDAARRAIERLRDLGADPMRVARLEHALSHRRLVH